MPATLIDGKAHAARLRDRLAIQVSQLKDQHGLQPGLAVILVGADPASEVYVRNKAKQTEEIGMLSRKITLPADTHEQALLSEIDALNDDPTIHGILVQLPLPEHINEDAVIERIAPTKDVDGFHPVNVGRLVAGEDTLAPCTPQGCMMMLKEAVGDLSGAHAVVIGRSNIVGKPMALLLLQEHCTVTIAHSRTKDLPALAATADILVAAVGRPEMVTADYVKPGATVIDVGINRVERNGKPKLVGDVAFDEVVAIAGAITPVPGGVGPMTIACLLANTVKAAAASRNIALKVAA